METPPAAGDVAEITLLLDDEPTPFASYRPPATCVLDTTALDDGPHVLHVRARDALGLVGVRSIPFCVQNGPGITITGLHAHERVSGSITLNLNAFSASEPFDPIRAESSGPIPVWTWVMIALIAAWAGWYGLNEYQEPAAFAALNAARDPVAAANAPMAKGFDFASNGANLYTANCAACHGARGNGVPGAFPPLAGDPVVSAANAAAQIRVVLHGLHDAKIKGTAYASQMPTFAQLSDGDIAAIIDHERTSWGNAAPTIQPDDVKRAR